MDEATKKALNDFLQRLISGAEQAGDFVVEQAPIVVQEWILYHRVVSALTFGAWALAAMLLLYVTYTRSWKLVMWNFKSCNCNNSPGPEFLFILTMGGGIGCLVGAAISVPWLVVSWLAPRVLIIQELRGLIR